MNIAQAEQMARAELGRRVETEERSVAGSERPRSISPEVAPSEDAPAPILPFFPVLLLGRDGWTAAQALPSVGYARGIYLAIAINWLIDLLGLAWLFHTYLATWDTAWIAVGAPLLLATLLSSGFAVFAVGLVQKPLRRPRVPRLSWPLRLTLGMLASLGLGVVLASQVFVAQGEWFALAVLAAEASLAVGAVVLLAAAFGVMDAIYVLARGVVMVSVGYLVATPLHEAMFEHEIEESFYTRQERRLEVELAALDTKASDETVSAGESCRIKAGFANDLDCRDLKRSAGEAGAMMRAYQFVAHSEENGYQDEAARKALEAEQVHFPSLADVLSIKPSARKKRGRLYFEYISDRDKYEGAMQEFERRYKACVAASARCEGETQPAARTANARERLTRELQLYVDRRIKLGAIDRALELEHLIEAREADSVVGAREVVWAKLRAAWILALMMPLIVVTMKLTAGARLEPFLDRRWKVS